MSGRLEVDTDLLARTGAALSALADTLASASADARGVAGAVGHAVLASEVEGFAVSWDDRRAGLVRRTRALGDDCVTVAATFAGADGELAGAVRSQR